MGDSMSARRTKLYRDRYEQLQCYWVGDDIPLPDATFDAQYAFVNEEWYDAVRKKEDEWFEGNPQEMTRLTDDEYETLHKFATNTDPMPGWLRVDYGMREVRTEWYDLMTARWEKAQADKTPQTAVTREYYSKLNEYYNPAYDVVHPHVTKGPGQLYSVDQDWYDTMTEREVAVLSGGAGEGGTKHDDGKARIDLVSYALVEGAGKALAFGAEKYDEDNWRKGLDPRRNIAACLRHIIKYTNGEELDQESGVSHLGHAAASLAMAMGTIAFRKKYPYDFGEGVRYTTEEESNGQED